MANEKITISVMLAVSDVPAAVEWYKAKDHQAPWGVHRQGGFVDPFGHIRLVGDRGPLAKH